MRKYKYKIVKKRNNKSCLINGNSMFCLTYTKDTNVYALEGTLGVMVFKTKTEAEDWFWDWDGEEMGWIIKRVIPIGRGKTPEEIAMSITTKNLKKFYEELEWCIGKNPINGTICYPGVYVVD